MNNIKKRQNLYKLCHQGLISEREHKNFRKFGNNQFRTVKKKY